MTGPDDRWAYTGEFLALPDDRQPPPPTVVGYPPAAWDSGPVPADASLTAPQPLSPLAATMLFLWLGCAVAGLIAPFLPFFAVELSSSFDREVASVDGWGHVSGMASSDQGSMWGLLLTVAAAVLVIAALGLLARREALWPALLGLLAATSLATVALAVALQAQAQTSNASAQLGLQTSAGAGVWLTVITGLVAAFAVLLGLRVVTDWRAPVEPS